MNFINFNYDYLEKIPDFAVFTFGASINLIDESNCETFLANSIQI